MKLLKPLSVPWMISPSVPKLSLQFLEDGGQFVKFAGFFGFENSAPSRSNSITVDSGMLIINPDEISARYQLISLHFKFAGWLKCSPQHSDREVISESDYDWSLVSGCIKNGETIDEWKARNNREWKKTKICPDPGAYVVENSDWNVGIEKERYNLKHFLILGESSFIEILAQDYFWTSEGNISR